MQSSFPTNSLLLITALAVLVPFLAARLHHLHIPIIVGELLCGMAIGHSGLNLVADNPVIDFLAAFGFSYLMFLSGLEMDLDVLWPSRRGRNQKQLLSRPLPIALMTFGVTLIAGLAVAGALAWADLIRSPLIMALILSTTSLGIVVPVLKERGLITQSYGQSVLVCALIADFATLPLITVAVEAERHGSFLKPLLAILLLGAFALVVRLGKWALTDARSRHLVHELSHATAQVRVRGSLALMIAFIALAEQLGAELILGAFLAGAVIALLSGRSGTSLHIKLDAIGFGFFIPFFFVMVGVHFDLQALLASRHAMTLVPLVLVAAYAIKLLAATCLVPRFGARLALAAGFLLSSRLSLIIAVATISLELGLIDDATNTAIILVAIITSTASPMLFSRCMPASRP